MSDSVKQPSHYTQGDVECIDAIRAMLGDKGFRSYCRGNAMKYLWRQPHKNAEVDDLRKAKTYIDFALETYTDAKPRKMTPGEVRLVQEMMRGEL